MKKIVFHKNRATFEAADGLKLSSNLLPVEVIEVLTAFEGTKYDTLHAMFGAVTGWKTRVWADEVVFEFVGDGWSEEQIAQAKYRAQPVFLRGKNADFDKKKGADPKAP